MANINSNDFYYYLHKTDVNTPEQIESFFNEGLKSRYEYSIHSTMYPVDENDLQTNGLQEVALNYLGENEQYKTVFVIKIPKRYFSGVIHRDNSIDPAVPLWRSLQGYDDIYNSAFTPKLIQGAYCRDINKSFTNPNFNPVFDPSGCQFANEQLERLNSIGLSDIAKSYESRRNIPFANLYASDKQQRTWENIINYYSQLYDVQPTQMVKYEMPDEDKQLFGGKTL